MNRPGTRGPRGFHLADLCALVVGYGMASLMVRAFWPVDDWPSTAEAVILVLFYCWLGLAMGGPLVLLVRRPAGPTDGDDGDAEDPDSVPVPGPPGGTSGRGPRSGDRSRRGRGGTSGAPGGAHTWAELAWLIIGFYWIALTVLVVPVRLKRSLLPDTALVGLFPIAAALVLQRLDRGRHGRRPAPGDAPAWTHRAAVGLLLTWPIAWVALILLGKSLL
jgi:hypothetical protein